MTYYASISDYVKFLSVKNMYNPSVKTWTVTINIENIILQRISIKKRKKKGIKFMIRLEI